jgi:hypothetical protein
MDFLRWGSLSARSTLLRQTCDRYTPYIIKWLWSWTPQFALWVATLSTDI